MLLGASVVSDETSFNMAYDVTDCGLVVGQLRTFVDMPNGPLPVYRAFVYSTRPRFGLPQEEVVFLPSIDADDARRDEIPAIARDVNADGWIVGDVGEALPTGEDLVNRRAIAWRLTASGEVETRQVHPPSKDGFVGYQSGGYGWLSAVSEGPQPWSAANFATNEFCSFGGTGIRFEQVAAVELNTNPPLVTHRVPCEYRFTPDTGDYGRQDAQGISPDGRVLCGTRKTCGYCLSCNGSPCNTRARQWLPLEDCPELVDELVSAGCTLDSLFTVACLTPDPIQNSSPLAAWQNAVLGNSSAAGYVSERWPEIALPMFGCAPWAFVWRPIPPCSQYQNCTIATAPPSLGWKLPILDLDGLFGSEAFDLEQNLTTSRGLRQGHFVVGDVRWRLDEKPEPSIRGYLWFKDGASLEASAEWQAADVNSLISPLSPPEGYSQVTVRALRGVNRNGDAVGVAELRLAGNPSADPVRRAVLLRAVPLGLVGDVDGEGTVGAADLAILLSAWCTQGGARRCDAVSDLNCDGSVGAADLALLLSNWSNSGGPRALAQTGTPVPPALALESMQDLQFSIHFVGLGDIDGYKSWAATAPTPLRELVEGVVWDMTKGDPN